MNMFDTSKHTKLDDDKLMSSQLYAKTISNQERKGSGELNLFPKEGYINSLSNIKWSTLKKCIQVTLYFLSKVYLCIWEYTLITL